MQLRKTAYHQLPTWPSGTINSTGIRIEHETFFVFRLAPFWFYSFIILRRVYGIEELLTSCLKLLEISGNGMHVTLTTTQWKVLSIMIYWVWIEPKLHMATRHLFAWKITIVRVKLIGKYFLQVTHSNWKLDNMTVTEQAVVSKEYQWVVLIRIFIL